MTDFDDVGGDAASRLRDWRVAVSSDDEAPALAALRRENQDLREALASQPVIDQAKGALMFRYGIDAETAFGLLVRWSQHTNTKVRELATALVLSLGGDIGDDVSPIAQGVERLLNRSRDEDQEPTG